MKTGTQSLFALSLVAASAAAGQAPSPKADEAVPYRHAYYLFLAGTPKGCEDCYVPLLLTTGPLEKMTPAPAPCVLITTYERDSIWYEDGMVLIKPEDIERQPRILNLRQRRYRYQEISAGEVLRLLKNPIGTIPISRPFLPAPAAPGPSLEALASQFGKLQ